MKFFAYLISPNFHVLMLYELVNHLGPDGFCKLSGAVQCHTVQLSTVLTQQKL